MKYQGGALTLSVWVYVNPTETTGGWLISKPWSGNGEYNYGLHLETNNTVSLSLQSQLLLTSPSALSTGQWHSVVATVDDANLMTLYVDGQSVASDYHTIVNWTPAMGDTLKPLAIGTLYPYGSGAWSYTGHAFDGKMDEVRLYRRALTADEVEALWETAAEPQPVVEAEHRTFDSFGQSTSTWAVDFQFGFTGRPWDADTALYDNRARSYDPRVGRWLTEDPTGYSAGDMNLYRYCGNSPVDRIDPSGHCSQSSSSLLAALGSSIVSGISSAADSWWSDVRPVMAQPAVSAIDWGLGMGSNIASMFTSVPQTTLSEAPLWTPPVQYTGPSIVAAPPRNFLQRMGDWISDVWNNDFVDENGAGVRLNDDVLTRIVRQVTHQNVQPIGGGLVDTAKFVAVDVPLFAYDHSLGIPLQGLERTFEADKQRLATLEATADLLANWDQVPDYQAPRIVQRVAAGAATFYGMELVAGRAISVPGKASRASALGEANDAAVMQIGMGAVDTGFYPRVPGTGVLDTGFYPQVPGVGSLDTGYFPALVTINRQAGLTFQRQVMGALGAVPAGAVVGNTLKGTPYTTIPDGILPTGGRLEVKLGQYISNSPQLQAQAWIGQQPGNVPSILVVRPGATVSAPVIRGYGHSSGTPRIQVYNPATGTFTPYP